MKIFERIASLFFGITIILGSIIAVLLWKGYQIDWTRFEIEHKDGLAAKEEKDRLDKELKEAQVKGLKGWEASNLDYNIQQAPSKESSFAIDEVDPDGAFKNKLFWSPEITQAFKDILQDLEDAIVSGSVNPDLAENKDNSYEHFKRRNCVLYGAPGTGKTEFIKQMARVIQERYQSWIAHELDPNNLNYEILKDTEYKAPPIIQIDGSTLKAPGKGTPAGDKIDSHEKLIAIIKKAKEDYYGEKYSNKPYIVFVEEADQGVNVTDSKENKLLEDWKNFLSTPRDDQQLKGGAQDFNSCIIIATNNYENIDPALFREGRLGKKLNFNWNPNLLKNYLEYWYKNDEMLSQLNFSLEEVESWKWNNNPEPEELYKMAAKGGFGVAKHELAPHLPKIYHSWQNLSEEEKKVKEAELGTRKNEDDKEICNWLLHYLYTFHQYNDKRQLHIFNDAKKIQRYNYGHQYRMEELQRNMIIQICQNVMALKDAIVTGLAQIRGEMAANFQEMAGLKQEILLVRQELKRAEQDINSLRSAVSSSSLDSSSIRSELNSLQSQINSIVNGINSSSSSGSQAVQQYSDLTAKIRSFTQKMKAYLESGGNDTSQIRKIVNDFIDDIK